MTRRRAVLASALLPLGALPIARAQPGSRAVRIGTLLFGNPREPNLLALIAGLRDLGWTEDRNVALEHRYAEGRAERLRELAGSLVATRPDLIFALGGDVVPFAKEATRSIPIVMVVSNDPVAAGTIQSFRRPGGNITGVAFVSEETGPKRLQYLKQAAPALTRVAVLWNPDHLDSELRDVTEAGRRLGVQVQSLELRRPEEFDAAFDAATRGRAEALMVVSSRFMSLNQRRILEFANARRMPLVSGWGDWAQAGGLLSYGPDLNVLARRAAAHADKILRGANPAELPVEQPTKFELVVNRRTAQRLGLSLPAALLAQADRIVD